MGNRQCTGFTRWLPLILSMSLSLLASLVFASNGVYFTIQMESWSPYYHPEAASVISGTVVQWENPTATHHTVTHDGCKQGGPCLFDSGSIPPTGVFELPKLPPGQYSYHCKLHPIMRGVLVVQDGKTAEEI